MKRILPPRLRLHEGEDNVYRRVGRFVLGVAQLHLYFSFLFAVVIYSSALIVGPVLFYIREGIWRLPEWVTPLKLLFAPFVVGAIATACIVVATLLGFEAEDRDR